MNEQRLCELIDALLETRITDAEREELRGILHRSAEARDLYWEIIELDVMLRDTVQESLGRDLAQRSLDAVRDAQPASDSRPAATPRSPARPTPPAAGNSHGAPNRGVANAPNRPAAGAPNRGVAGSTNGGASGGASGGATNAGNRAPRPAMRDEYRDREVPEQFATRWSAELRRSPSSWLAGAFLLALIGLIGWGIGDWRRQSRPIAVPPTRATVATLRGLEGAAWRVVADNREIKISPGHAFRSGDTLRVGESSVAEVVLADGSRIGLGIGSMLRFPDPQESPRGELYLARGMAEVRAMPQPSDRPLVIATVAARLTVLGTHFRLYTHADDSRVELIEGKVRFERRVDGQAVDVGAGQYAIATTQVAPSEPLVAHALDDVWRLRHTLERAGERVAFSHDGVWLATARLNQVGIWDVASGEPCYQQATTARFDALAFSRDNAALVALSHQGPALHWPFAERTALATDLAPVAGKMRWGAISRDGRWLAQSTGADPGYLALWNNERAGMPLPMPALPMKSIGVAIATPPAGPLVVGGDEQGGIAQWEAMTGRELVLYRLPSPLHVLDVSPDGRWLAGYGHQIGLILLDLATGVSRPLWPAAGVRANDVRFAADGRSVFAAMADGVARAWATEDGEPLLALATGDVQLRSIDLSADGQWLAIAGDRERVTLWRIEPKARP
jgi:ferric-dicitrate binding protein FerR (iron transport regulator)